MSQRIVGPCLWGGSQRGDNSEQVITHTGNGAKWSVRGRPLRKDVAMFCPQSSWSEGGRVLQALLED